MTFDGRTQQFDAFDEKMMRLALDLARKAGEHGEVPIGAVLVSKDQKILSSAINSRETLTTPLGHAEMSVLHKSARDLKSWRLLDTTLYVTLEPCFMCAGALISARVKRVVFAARDPKAGALKSLANLGEDPRLNHRFQIDEGLFAEEAGKLLKDFFKQRRQKNKI